MISAEGVVSGDRQGRLARTIAQATAYLAVRAVHGRLNVSTLKRFVVREIYHAIRADFEAAHTT
ncbi:hypothetical protein C8E05_2494 [Rhodococcus wratislaviensis]|uniref:Uncharacterized protein n=3 Tax=Nocardiaceae TaxID=85025 RepID=A0AB38F8R4_RHOWR|nr:hypothetical protein EP51_14555 [Rhodococcus opacus]REE73093.1 hypothetical protein C8E05_2494 [Rhodococcus wratislaviensis]SPZ37883.1 Uncharacterised protein [Rhodococcus wratislaviensis]